MILESSTVTIADSGDPFWNEIAVKYTNLWERNTPSGLLEHKRISDIFRNHNLFKPGDRVIDVGCGKAAVLDIIFQSIGDTGYVCGTDTSGKMLREAQKKAARLELGSKTNWVLGDFINNSFASNNFDKVMAFNCFPHFEDKSKFFRNAASCIRPNGKVIIAHKSKCVCN